MGAALPQIAEAPSGAPEGGFNGGGVVAGCGGSGVSCGASSPEGVAGIAVIAPPIKTPRGGGGRGLSVTFLFEASRALKAGGDRRYHPWI
jgi:hypothetical protein